MHNRLIILGAGGQGKVVADIATELGYADIAFLDDNAVGKCLEFPIAGKCCDAEKYDDGATDFVIAIGDNATRKRIASEHELNYTTLIHPTANVSARAAVGRGTVVSAGATVNVCATVGEHCIINSGSIVEHDDTVGDFVHISPRAALGGAVSVGDSTHIGIGAAVRDSVIICKSCIIGAGAAVIADVAQSGIYIGVPARMVEGCK